MKILMWHAFIGFLCVGIPFALLVLQKKIWSGPTSEESETKTEKERGKSLPADWEKISRTAVLILVLLAIGFAIKLAFSEVGDIEIAGGITLRNRVSLYWLSLVLLGSALTIWLIQKGVNKPSESNKEMGTGILAPLIGIMFVVLLFTASYYLLQAGAHYQTERGLLATQGLRNPPQAIKPRVTDSATSVVLNPGELSEPIKVDGTQDFWIEPLEPGTPRRDVSILRYYPRNGGSFTVVTNKWGDEITYVMGFQMRLKSERKSGSPIKLEVVVGRK